METTTDVGGAVARPVLEGAARPSGAFQGFVRQGATLEMKAFTGVTGDAGGYAVFEGLALGDYGNRIPSLTFEVVADDGPCAIDAIAVELAPEIAADPLPPLSGFAASGDSVRAVVDLLAQAGGAWCAASGGGVVMRSVSAAQAADGTAIEDVGAAAGKGTRRARAIAGWQTIPGAVEVAHYDAARDYQTGLQRARRPGGGLRSVRVAMPAVLPAAAAKALAEAMLARAETERTTRTVALGLEGLAIAPGAVVRIAGEGGRWRVTKARVEAMAVTLDLVALVPASTATSASSGRALPAPDRAIGATRLHAFELPALDDTLLSAPRILVAATGAGAGWRSAALLYSLDEGASWTEAGGTAAPATMGVIETPPEAASAGLYDRRSAVVVRLARADMTLGDADDASLDRGANLALLGDELVQFGDAVPLGDGRWRLSRLLRGRRGTEGAIGAQVPGDRFVLIEAAAVRALDLPLAALGRRVRVLASGVGDTAGPVEADVTVGGASLRPPSPVHVEAVRTDTGTTLRWIRRSRLGWRWIDGVDAPIGEEREGYRVSVTAADGAVRTIAVAGASATFGAGELGAGATFAVRQQGTVAESLPASVA